MASNAHVVLIHGMWCTPASMAELRKVFEIAGYEVHTPALPFHECDRRLTNADQKALAIVGIQYYVNSLARYINGIDGTPIIVGHSMGGLLAQLIASRIPSRGLILLSSAAPAGINSWSWPMIRTFGHNLLKFPLWRKTTCLRISNIAYGIANSQSVLTQQHILSQVIPESGRASMEIGLWFLLGKQPTRVNYDSITCPVLIIGGTEDRITPVSIQRKLAKKYGTKATLKILHGACHWTIGGKHFGETKNFIQNWLESTDRSI